MTMKPLNILDTRNRALCIGDIHGNIDQFQKAVDLADKEDLFLVSLGDLTDYGDSNYECINLMFDLLKNGKAAMVRGNHDFKFNKYIIQRAEDNILMSVKHGISHTIAELDALSTDDQDDFMEKFVEIYDMSRFHYVTRDTMFVHAAMSNVFWTIDQMTGKQRARAIFGQVEGTLDNGYPNRVYHWADTVPADNTVYFGHDILDDQRMSVLGTKANVFSMDTGSSKTGRITGAIIEHDGHSFKPVKEIQMDTL